MHIINSNHFHPLFSFLILLCLLKKPFFPTNPRFIFMPCFRCAVLGLTVIAWVWTGFTFWSSYNINLPVAIPLKKQHCLPRQQFLANSSQKSRTSKPLHMDLRDFSVLSYEDHVWGTTAACHECKSHDKSRRLLEELSVCLTSWLSRKEPGSLLDLARIQPRKLPPRELGCSFYAFFSVPQVDNTLSVLWHLVQALVHGRIW